jgi:hypothetical protein
MRIVVFRSCRGARPRLTMKTIRQSSIGSSLGGNRSLAWGFRRRRWDESKWTRQRDREHSRTAVRRLFQACRPERRCALDTGCCFSVLSFWPKAFGSTRAVCSPRRFSPVRAASTQVVCSRRLVGARCAPGSAKADPIRGPEKIGGQRFILRKLERTADREVTLRCNIAECRAVVHQTVAMSCACS